MAIFENDVVKVTTSDTLTDQAVSAVCTMLKLGELGEPIPPERQLASLLGISRVTMRRAMTALESAGLVRRKQGQGTYACFGPEISIVDEVAAVKKPFVVVLTDQESRQFNPQLSPWTWQVCRHLEVLLTRQKLQMVFLNSEEFLHACEKGEFQHSGIRGFVAPTHLWRPDVYEEALGLGIPFVGIGRTSRTVFWNIIDLDHQLGLRKAFEHLAPKPKDRVFIPLQEHPREVDRQSWFECVMWELSGRGVPASQIVVKAGGMFEAQGYLATKWYLREYEPPTIILADFDLCIVGAYRALLAARENGTLRANDLLHLRCLGGGDLAIGRRMDPGFGSLRFDSEQVAQMIVEMLQEQRATKQPVRLRYLEATFNPRT
ncbi:MAG: GntR family transcriptional regulator [Planctomycetes bacterium]|nr:GntR family transcriptional regulator [Planctomycetota bacterium]